MTMTKTLDCVECGAVGPVRTVVVPIVRCASGVRDGRSQVRRSGRPGRGRTGEPSRRCRSRGEHRPADAPPPVRTAPRRPRNASARRLRSWTRPSRRRPPRARLRPRRPRRSRRRRPTPDRRRSSGPDAAAGPQARRGRAARARPGSVRADPRRGPEPDAELRADPSRSGAERRLDPGTDPRSRRRDAQPRPRPRAAAKAAPTPAAAKQPPTDVTPEEPAPIPSAIGTAGRTPSYAPTPAAAAACADQRAGHPGAIPDSATEAERVEAERAAIVPLLEPSAIASLPPTPWAPLEEPAPALVARPYQRHLAFELDAVDTGPPPSAYRPPSPAVLMATATAAANDAARAHPATDGSGAGGAEATMTRDSTWWLNTVPDPARFVEIAGWFIVVGAAMSLLGFLLPWSRVVIGARTNGGYFDGWGLASPTHLFVFVGLLDGPRPGHPPPARPGLDLVGHPGSRLRRTAARPCLAVPGRPARRRRRSDHGHARRGRPADRWRAGAVGDPSRRGGTARLKARRPNGGSERPPATLRRARQTEPGMPSRSG